MKFLIFLLTTIFILISGGMRPSTVLAQQTSYDLLGVSLNVSPASPQVNQDTTLRAVFKNNGSDFKMDFIFNNNPSLDSFVSDAPTAVSPGQNSLIKTNDNITITFFGHFTRLRENNISVAVDLSGHLIETNTDNNLVSGQVYVLGNDLLSESISLSPVQPAVNQACTISVLVKNNGTNNLLSSTGLFPDYNFPDFKLSKITAPSPSLVNVVKPGDELTFVYEGKFIAAGEKQLNFTIDPNDDLKQSDLNNNNLNLKVNVYPASSIDLSVDSLSLNTDQVLLGQPVVITATIKNTGSVSLVDAIGLTSTEIAPSFPNFVYDINTVTHDSYPTAVAPLDPGALFHYVYNGTFNKTGSVNLAFSLDKNNQLAEANENNNSTSTKIIVYQDERSANDFTILSKSVSLISSTSVMIGWTTSAETVGTVNYGEKQGNVYDDSSVDSNGALEHNLTITGLKPATSYNYLISVSRNTVSKTSDMASFTLPADDRLKIISGPTITVDSQNKTAQVNWSTNLTANGYVYYKKSGTDNYDSAGSGDSMSVHQIKLENLDIGQYSYFIVGTSTVGSNVKSANNTFSVVTAETPSSNDQPGSVNQGSKNSNSNQTATSVLIAKNIALYNKLKGDIILKVQSHGEAYYVDPKTKNLYFLGRPDDAYAIIRQLGQGITNSDLAKIPIGFSNLSGQDSDNDGLPDTFEQAIGTDKDKADTDGDGHNDKEELMSGYSPTASGKSLTYDKRFTTGLLGRIFLQVQSHGEAWYLNPKDGKRYFLARPADAFNIMRQLGLGISNNDFTSLNQ